MEERMTQLTISRREGEIVDIAGCKVQVKEIRPGAVRLMFVFPKSVPIYRQELIDAKGDGDAAA